MRWSLLFAALGVLAAFLILVLLKIQALVTDPGPELGTGIVVGLATLLLSAALLGRLAGRLIYLGGNNILFSMVIGVALALSCVFLTVIAGTVIVVLIVESKQPSRSNPLESIGAILFWIMVWGSTPAAFLGLLYGVLTKITLDRRLKSKPVA
jgi:hypothetical protein